MKKFTFLAVIVLIGLGLNANAQIQQGNVLVGADFADLSLGLNSPSTFNVNITPKAAWFIKDNVALGGYVNLGLQTGNGATNTTYAVGALGRYYTGKDVEVLRHGRFFGEGEFGIGGQHLGGVINSNTNGLDFSFGPGFAYFVTPNIGLETLLKYNAVAGFGDQAYYNTLTLNFGLQIYLPGKGTANKVKGDMR